jgi:hypothetical protein
VDVLGASHGWDWQTSEAQGLQAEAQGLQAGKQAVRNLLAAAASQQKESKLEHPVPSVHASSGVCFTSFRIGTAGLPSATC